MLVAVFADFKNVNKTTHQCLAIVNDEKSRLRNTVIVVQTLFFFPGTKIFLNFENRCLTSD